MIYQKYQHVERLGTSEVEGILNGTVYLFTKLDGSNMVLFDKDGVVCGGSRNRQLTIENDNAGSYAYVLSQEKFKKFFEKHTNVYLYGEWLVKHHIRTYEEDAWRKLYVFDVMREDGSYLAYEEYVPMLEEFGIEYIPLIAKPENPTEEQVREYVDKCTFLQTEGNLGEGICVKRYDYTNKYGRTTWAKIVRGEFKQTKKANKPIDGKSVEKDIVDNFCTEQFIRKEYEKIVNDAGEWNSKMIPRLIGVVWREFVKEETYNFVKKYKNPNVNFKLLNVMVTDKIKETMKELF
jgi:hypothetical protein|uniref:RNA ligase 2 n=1 Tax=Myoviridae sp. ctqfO1 TaxID=2827710 RepID=A0A8S5T3E8_9CAUD|nr:MAG TPA: RNA ligase 2 [Myoviridae sp. ctqfO1]